MKPISGYLALIVILLMILQPITSRASIVEYRSPITINKIDPFDTLHPLDAPHSPIARSASSGTWVVLYEDYFDQPTLNSTWSTDGNVSLESNSLCIARTDKNTYANLPITFSGNFSLVLNITLQSMSSTDGFHGLGLEGQLNTGLDFGFTNYGNFYYDIANPGGRTFEYNSKYDLNTEYMWNFTSINNELTISVDGSVEFVIDISELGGSYVLNFPGYYDPNEGSANQPTKSCIDNIMLKSEMAFPVVDFGQSDVLTLGGKTVNYLDESTGSPTYWLWDFGDGSTSTDKLPIHHYQDSGNYTVKLTAGNQVGEDSISKIVEIKANKMEFNFNDITFELGTLNGVIVWQVGYIYGGSFSAFINNEEKVYNNSLFGDTIEILTELFQIGANNLTVELMDAFDNFATFSIKVTVTEKNPPIISSPSDIFVNKDESTNITWTAQDQYPGKYNITVDGQLQVVNNGWSNGNITYNISILEVGNHTITIFVSDHFGNEVEDTVIVQVLQPSESVQLTVPYTLPLMSFIVVVIAGKYRKDRVNNIKF